MNGTFDAQRNLRQIASLEATLADMREHPYRETGGEGDRISDRLEELRAELIANGGGVDVLTKEVVPNPVVRVTALNSYPGWEVWQYQDGHYVASHRDGACSIGYDSFLSAVAHVRVEDGSRGAL